MKVAIYMEDGLLQLVMTSQGEFEKNALSTFENKKLNVEIKSGSFYQCQGGWIRQSGNDDKSIFLIINSEIKEDIV